MVSNDMCVEYGVYWGYFCDVQCRVVVDGLVIDR
jgi:hypothetical protein